MISSKVVTQYEPLILAAVDELFQQCISRENKENDFLIFLENGHFEPSATTYGSSPYVIGQGFDGAKDGDRMAFVETFVKLPYENKYNNASNLQEKFEIRRESTVLSMMVYVHFWESKVFLRKLRILAMMSKGEAYDWNLVVRPENTYTFIKNEIREIFKINGLKIYDIIKDAYKSQIRNAFAHSDFYLSNNKVYLDNYDPLDQWSIQFLTNDEFDKIITLTLLIHHALTIKIDEYREKLGIENPDREIFIPENGGIFRKLHYRQAGSIYRWIWPSALSGE